MGTISTSNLSTEAYASTMLHERDVSDKVRNLSRGDMPLFQLVSQGKMQDGEMVKSNKGLITKRKTYEMRVEGYYHDPLPVTRTVATGNSATPVLASADGIRLKQIWKDTTTDAVGVVDAISGTTITFESIGGTSFAPATGATLEFLGNTFEEGSSDPYIIAKTDDNYYNDLFRFRFPVGISLESMKSKRVAGGDYYARQKRNNAIWAMQGLEAALMWSERAASGRTTTLTNIAKAVYTCRGMWNWAQTSFNAGGSMSPSKFRKDLMLALHDSISSSKKLSMFCSDDFHARASEWINEAAHINVQPGELEKWGVRSTKFVTTKNMIELVPHPSFSRPGNTNKGLITCLEDWEYVHLDGEDIRINENIQDNDEMAKKDELTGVISILPKDGGYSTMAVTNLF
jgi:hypothetical protein